MRRIWRAAALVVAVSCAVPGALAAADSFTPVRLGIRIAPVARRSEPLRITVHVSADPGVLDTRTGPLWIQVKLAPECGGTYRYTPGPVLLDKKLHPQPSTGRAYGAVARGKGSPDRYGEQTVCAFLGEQGDARTFASDQSIQLSVSRPCTSRAARYDADRRALRKARRSGHGVLAARRRARRARRAARRACGPGVRL